MTLTVEILSPTLRWQGLEVLPLLGERGCYTLRGARAELRLPG